LDLNLATNLIYKINFKALNSKFTQVFRQMSASTLANVALNLQIFYAKSQIYSRVE